MKPTEGEWLKAAARVATAAKARAAAAEVERGALAELVAVCHRGRDNATTDAERARWQKAAVDFSDPFRWGP